MEYIVAWSIMEKQKKPKKNQLFILPAIQHDLYELKRRKTDAVRRYNGLLKTDAIAVMWGKIEHLTIQK